VFEIGYRTQPFSAVSYSMTAFHHHYDRLRSVETSAAGPVLDNKITGTTTGIEKWGSYQVTKAWQL
jgi:iron complex outermembrane receptor protein